MNLSASPCSMNQNAMSKPTARRMVTMVSQSLRAHHSVNKKQTPSTMLATLLATMLKPQKVKSAPISELPRYPAGSVMNCLPPRMCVTPPSCGSRLIDSTRPPVQHAVMACPNSWKAITSICYPSATIPFHPIPTLDSTQGHVTLDSSRPLTPPSRITNKLTRKKKTYFERPQHPSHIRQVPQQRNNNHICSYHAQRHTLRVIHAQPAPREALDMRLGCGC